MSIVVTVTGRKEYSLFKGKRDDLSPEYVEYMNSEAWEDKKAQVFETYGRSCFWGGSTCSGPLQVHHRNYFRFGGQEEMGDLMILCKKHHQDWHSG